MLMHFLNHWWSLCIRIRPGRVFHSRVEWGRNRPIISIVMRQWTLEWIIYKYSCTKFSEKQHEIYMAKYFYRRQNIYVDKCSSISFEIHQKQNVPSCIIFKLENVHNVALFKRIVSTYINVVFVIVSKRLKKIHISKKSFWWTPIIINLK